MKASFSGVFPCAFLGVDPNEDMYYEAMFFFKMIIEKIGDIMKVVIKLHIDAKFHTK
jgi:hypothetical protein